MNNLKVIFETLGTGQVSDAMGKKGVLQGLHPMNPNLHMFGMACTVQIEAGDNLTLHMATKVAKPGDVIVVNSDGNLDIALWGELMSLCAKKHSIAGVVIDGAVRDIDALMHMDFPVYTKGVTPLGPTRLYEGLINIPIICSGVLINPGDYVLGDCDGVVVIPADQIDKVIVTADLIKEREIRLKKSIECGEYLFDCFQQESIKP